MIEHPIARIAPLQFPLVNRFYKDAGHKGCARGDDIVFALREHGKIAAAVRLCPAKDDAQGWLLLRGLWVLPARQRCGLGTQLMQFCINQTANRNLWCYPFTHLEEFYAQFGFTRIDVLQMPAFILGPYEAYTRAGKKIIAMTRQPVLAPQEKETQK